MLTPSHDGTKSEIGRHKNVMHHFNDTMMSVPLEEVIPRLCPQSRQNQSSQSLPLSDNPILLHLRLKVSTIAVQLATFDSDGNNTIYQRRQGMRIYLNN